MKTQTVAQKIQSNPDLIPSLPDVITKAMKLVEDPNVKPGDLEKLLSNDPGLVATMLRLANSPIYGFAHKRETVRDAIIGMGLNGLRGVLLGSSMKRFVGGQFKAYGDPMTLWRHAMAVGSGARLLNQRLPKSPDNSEEMFVAGLLHDLGKVLLAPFLTRMGEDMTKCTVPVHSVEERILGINHMKAGGIVAEMWNLKPMVREVITRHHYRSCDEQHRHAIAVVRLADQCATNNGYGAGQTGPDSDFLTPDLAVIGLEPEEWKEVGDTIAEAVGAALSDA
ncbi:MAG: HD-like signal output (HDOD) protein [Planctomycetota bacterium]|jgi:HD-like signal output (HDOD) protein